MVYGMGDRSYFETKEGNAMCEVFRRRGKREIRVGDTRDHIAGYAADARENAGTYRPSKQALSMDPSASLDYERRQLGRQGNFGATPRKGAFYDGIRIR